WPQRDLPHHIAVHTRLMDLLGVAQSACVLRRSQARRRADDIAPLRAAADEAVALGSRGSGCLIPHPRSSPRKRGPSSWLWIPACAGMSGECFNAGASKLSEQCRHSEMETSRSRISMKARAI